METLLVKFKKILRQHERFIKLSDDYKTFDTNVFISLALYNQKNLYFILKGIQSEKLQG
jgi:hypothetical protein